MISWQNFTYHYDRARPPALNGISLTILPGELMLVIGPSGAGKSTLLRSINGLVPHFYGGSVGGTVTVHGRNPIAEGPGSMSDLVGLVFQNPESQFVTEVVEDELAFAMENHNLPPTLMRKRIEEVLDQLSIAHLRRRRVSTLSGGERQRVAIGSVLTLQPKVLVLDEPTSQLDPQAAEEVLNVLHKLNQDLGLTIILSEHRLERVVQYADRICYLPQPGAAPRVGPPQEVLAGAQLAPPIIQLAHHFNWRPTPLTIKAGRRFATHLAPPPTMPPAAAGPLPPAGPPLVDIQKVWFSYNGHEALRGVSLRAQAGEFIALMGRNGAGKSTLLKHVVGLLKPNRGRITVAGFDTRRVAAQTLAQTVGFVPQNSGRLLFKETLAEEMEFSRRAHQHHANGHAIAGQILTELGLSRFAGTHPRDLSVGERQRAALATILVGRPRLLLLDEPTRGLDYHNKQTLIAILKRLQAQGVTIVMATHDVELVAQCAGRVIIMGEGQVVVDGPVREVMSESMVFSSQINKLFKNPRFLTVADVMQVYA